jgi:hypothetical protein
LALGALAIVFAASTGCTKPDEIEAYSAPSSREQEKVRLLAVIIKRGHDVWFIKFVGPIAAVHAERPKFEQFLDSLHFPPSGEPPLAWTLPDGWTQESTGSRLRFATFKMQSGDTPLEVTITKLGAEAASIIDNVNRWRRLDLGLTTITEGLVGLVTSDRQVANGPATLVDMVGPGPSKSDAPRPQLPSDHPSPPPRLPVEFEAPVHWTRKPSDGIRPVIFGLEDGDEKGEVGMMSLPGLGGGVLPNVNRWRGQLGLEAWSEDELKMQMRGVAVDGEAAVLVELVGTGGAPQALVGVIAPRSGQTWFVTLKGPARLVERQRPAFDTFLKSVRFVTAAGDANE